MKHFTVATLIVLSLLGLSSAALAQHKAGHQKQAEAAALPEGEQRLVQRLSQFLEIPTESIISMKERGLGWGDIEMAVLISRQGGASLETVISQWEAGQGSWAVIGQSFGIDDVESLKGERPAETEESDPPAEPTP